jgi:methylmalonyl-CoA/ethylmalonyl-CoA epimerase
MSNFRKIDHIGVAVRSIAASARLYVEKLGLPLGAVETVETEGVRVAFLGDGETHVELLEPIDAHGPVAKFIEKRGEGIHHICFAVGDIDASVTALRAAGITLVGEAPRPGAGGCRVAFLHPKETGGILLELSQRPEEPAPRHLAPGSTVLAYLSNPKERHWGVLREITSSGVTLEGIDLNSFDDWVSAAAAGGATGASVVFFPSHRVERLLLDRSEGDAEALDERFRARVGVPLATWLASQRRR